MQYTKHFLYLKCYMSNSMLAYVYTLKGLWLYSFLYQWNL